MIARWIGLGIGFVAACLVIFCAGGWLDRRERFKPRAKCVFCGATRPNGHSSRCRAASGDWGGRL